MDNLFRTRVLTSAVNEMQAPEARVFNRLFAPKANMQISDRLAFDIITGSQQILPNLAVNAEATVTNKVGRKTVTVTAPRLSSKRYISAAELNAVRAYGSQMTTEMLKDRIAREQFDMVGEHGRTKEFWAVNALKGKIYDSDMTTVLVDYNADPGHSITLTLTDLWTDAASDPANKIREWKKIIEDDSNANITGWLAYCGSGAMDALLSNVKVRELLKYDKGAQIAETGRIQKLVEVELDEYLGSYQDSSGTRQRFIADDELLLIGLCNDLIDCPYAPVVDLDAPKGVGNITAAGKPVSAFSKSWKTEEPSGRWIKVETRPLPVLQRPGAVIRATVV